LALAKAYANDGQHENCRRMVEALEGKGCRSLEGDLLLAATLFNDDQAEAALARLADCERLYPPSAQFFNLVGNIHLARRGWRDAADAFAKSLALDGESPQALDGAAHAALKLDDFESAAEHALRAIGLLFFFPQAHFRLGMAFKGMGETARAIRSLKLAVTQAPNFLEAHQELQNLREASPHASQL
jgi:tetratricopeptide (TPR) repeat protein